MADIVNDTIRYLREAAGVAIDDAAALAAERRVRRKYGGGTAYVGKHDGDRRAGNQAIATDYLAGVPLSEICARHCISRSTIYKRLKETGGR